LDYLVKGRDGGWAWAINAAVVDIKGEVCGVEIEACLEEG
jgi:hypothetical protein